MYEIDLLGPDGNAYVLMGYTKQVLRAMGYSGVEIREVLDDMMSSDYKHLVDTMLEVTEGYITVNDYEEAVG